MLAALALMLLLPRPSAARVDDSESSYRLRLAALTLATGSAPVEDRFLAPAEAQRPAWPIGVHGLWGLLQRRTDAPAAARAGRGELFDRDWEARARALDPALAIGVLLAACLAVWSFCGARSTRACTWALALTALLCVLALRDSGARVLAPDRAALLLASCLLACVGWRARVSSVSDAALIQLTGGLACGALIQVSPVAWPLVVATALLFARALPALSHVDSKRTWALLWLGCAAVLLLPSRSLGLARPWPEWSRGTSGWLAAPYEAWLVIPYAAACAVVWRARDRSSERTWLLAVGALYALFAAIDGRFGPLTAALGGATVALAVAELARRGRAVRALSLALAVLVGVGLASRHAQAETRRDTDAYLAGLHWLRDSTQAPVAWNHPLARGAAGANSVLCNPLAAGNVAFHARRPVPAMAFPGIPAGERERGVARLLVRGTEADLAGGVLRLGADLVVVAARDLDDRASLERLAGVSRTDAEWRDSALVRLVTGESLAGLVRVHASPELARARELGRDVPVLSIYRVAQRPATWSE